MMNMIKERNQYIDIMRGLAMLLVVLGHTMTGCTVDSEKSFLFNIIWSLQMPLFILISGYVTKYSREISGFKGRGRRFFKRKTVAYLLPCIIWSLVIRGILLGETNFLNLKYMLWHMDSGYWFLVTIWTISIIFGLSVFGAKNCIKSSKFKQQIVMTVLYIIGMICLMGIGMIFGMSFFAIKLTLYYMPFYFLGYLFGQYEEKLFAIKKGKQIVDLVVVICLGVWLYSILRYSLYDMSDSGVAIIFRAVISLMGCIAVCGLCRGMFSEKKGEMRDSNSVECKGNQEQQFSFKELIIRSFHWFGKHSLEVYLIHGLFLNILRTKELKSFFSITGYTLTLSNYLITILLCYMSITLFSKSDILKKTLCLK